MATSHALLLHEVRHDLEHLPLAAARSSHRELSSARVSADSSDAPQGTARRSSARDEREQRNPSAPDTFAPPAPRQSRLESELFVREARDGRGCRRFRFTLGSLSFRRPIVRGSGGARNRKGSSTGTMSLYNQLTRRGDKLLLPLLDARAEPQSRAVPLLLPNSCQYCKNPACLKGCCWHETVPSMRDQWLAELMKAYGEFLTAHAKFNQIFGIVSRG